MEHRIGHFELVRWQGSKSRRLKPVISVWGMILIAFGLVGLMLMGAQGLGWIRLTGASVFAPGAFMLVAATGPLMAFFRAALVWLLG
jgi:hypothetical protein